MPVRPMLQCILRVNTPPKILAVDDNRSVTLSMGFVFAKPRYEFSSIENGVDALTILEDDSYDVIIVDQQMPDLSGLELVREVRKRGISAKVIAVAAVLPSDVRLEYEKMGVEIIFDKPFDVLQLRSAVDSLVA
jgi:two-component system, response regulator, stage 0 sporulation protein F